METEKKNPLPREITAPSGIAYRLGWTQEHPEYKTRLDDAAKQAAEFPITLEELTKSNGIILDEYATDEQRENLFPIYVQAVTKSDGSTVLSAVRFRIRKLTNRECYRLMDVPDNRIDDLLTKKEVTKKDGTTTNELAISRSSHYKLAGNSIVVNCLARIYEQLWYPSEKKQLEEKYEQMTLDFEF